jgi:3alpha(or 20beta)-hydroxysteroid dehydrogenase
MTDLLDGKVIVVTGAGRGQGAWEVQALRRAGAAVLACDQRWDAAPSLDPARHDDPGRVIQRDLDVSDPAGWAAVADLLKREFGEVHGLVNNAGVALRARLGEVDVADWNRVFAVNTTGPLLGMQALLPLMRRGASIVNIGSLAALTAHPAVAYTASKWALRGLTRSASMQLGERGIRVNLVNPGFIDTPMTDAAPETFRTVNIANTPLGRTGQAADVAAAVLFLLSPESGFITGAEIPVDGGQWAHGGAKVMYDGDKAAGPAPAR